MTTTAQPYGIVYPIMHGPSGYFAQTYSVLDQVKTNLLMLLQTKKGERRMNPTFGSGIWAILFQNGADTLSPIIEATIRKDISTWMPYVNIKSVSIEVNANNSNELDASVEFTVPSIGITQLQTLEATMNNPVPTP